MGKGKALEAENKAATRDCRAAGSYGRKEQAVWAQLPPWPSIWSGTLGNQKEHKAWLMLTKTRLCPQKDKLESKPRI